MYPKNYYNLRISIVNIKMFDKVIKSLSNEIYLQKYEHAFIHDRT